MLFVKCHFTGINDEQAAPRKPDVDLSIWQIFPKSEGVSLSQKMSVSVANGKIQVYRWKLGFWKTCICYHEFDNFPIQDFSGDIGSNVN